MIEVNIDDMHSEYLGSDFQEKLLEIGAKDFYWTAIQMKKARPALKLSVLTQEENLQDLSHYILEHSSAIGLRFFPVDRHILSRRLYTLNTSYGEIQVKEVTTPSGQKRHKIEYESLWRLSQQHGMSIQTIQIQLMKEMG